MPTTTAASAASAAIVERDADAREHARPEVATDLVGAQQVRAPKGPSSTLAEVDRGVVGRGDDGRHDAAQDEQRRARPAAHDRHAVASRTRGSSTR